MSPSSKDLVYNADELIKVSETLSDTVQQISDSCLSQFFNMKSQPFYTSGRAEESMDKIVSKDGRGEFGETIEDFAISVIGDYFGKIQMLCQYYSLLSEYAFSTMIEVQEMDEEIARYIQKCQEAIVGEE